MKKKPLVYFYLQGEMDGKLQPLLHRKLHINRGADEIRAWCYPLSKRVAYTYTDVKRRMEPALTTQEVSKILGRHRVVLEKAILRGDFEPPQFTYGINENRKKYKYLWHEDDIINAHAYFSTVHRGRPRKDGLITPAHLPTVREIRALVRNQEVLYVKDGDDFKPVWAARDYN